MRSRKTLGRLIAGAIISLPALSFSAELSTYHVSPKGSTEEACGSPSMPCSLQTALTKAQRDRTDSQILLAPGTYRVTRTLIYSTPNGDGKLIIRAKDPQNKPVITGEVQLMRIATDDDAQLGGDQRADVTIRDIVFRGGKAKLDGGALSIHTAQASATVQNCEFISSESEGKGGALAFRSELNGSLYLINSTFKENSAREEGGALYASTEGGEVQIISTDFLSNTARKGGGAMVVSKADRGVRVLGSKFLKNRAIFTGGLHINGISAVSVVNSEFMGNQSSDMGGGLFTSSRGKVTVKKNIFWENFTGARGGGALLYSDSEVVLTNNMMVANSASYRGGGAFVSIKDSDDFAYIENNIISDNWADEGCNDGDDLYVDADYDGDAVGGNVHLRRNILGSSANSRSANSEDLVVSNYKNLSLKNNLTSEN